MTQQPEALRLADALEKDGEGCTCCAHSYSECCCDAEWADAYTADAAAELRRQHELLTEALYALEYASDLTKPEDMSGCDCPICTVILKLKGMK